MAKKTLTPCFRTSDGEAKSGQRLMKVANLSAFHLEF